MSEKILIRELKLPMGELILGAFQGKICLCDWKYRKMRDSIDQRIKKYLQSEFTENKADNNHSNAEVIEKTKSQLLEYVAGQREAFDLPIQLCGTEFQQKVWEELIEIPYGRTETYLNLSRKLGDEKAIRAVATANGANALSIIIPCHRIVGSNGELVGYAGGLSAKKKLLELEAGSFQQRLFA